ncbi:MAG: glycerol-3-phosphate dehydrogenase/oxidase [Bacteroidota bacterium]|nr:glycerol-3-phosphate dehydrogenase/oxidase [Bacteroidota bacterium]
MRRELFIDRIRSEDRLWDVIIIGGGATGLGAAVDAASRGFRTVLLEQSDFASGTSSRSTKLIHGGVRYLRQGNLSLVREALRERSRLFRNAPHLVRNLKFMLPAYSRWERPFYGMGLKAYDLLAGRQSLGKSHLVSRACTLNALPGIRSGGLRGSVAYHDGQFDDARMAVVLARTAVTYGAAVVNHVRVAGLLKAHGRVNGVVARDLETGTEMCVAGHAVVNATGVTVDAIRRMDRPQAPAMVRPSQGIHVVVNRSVYPSRHALLIPRTTDGRVLFAVPWLGRVLLGTTDTPVHETVLEPFPGLAEIEYLINHAAGYLERRITPSDVQGAYAGLRPLVRKSDDQDTAAIARDHVVRISKSGLITVAGGKWTTYRRMAEAAINTATQVGGLEVRPCITKNLPLHGWQPPADEGKTLHRYGSDRSQVEAVIGDVNNGEVRLHPDLPYLRGEVHWAVRHEMARTVSDVLVRRIPLLILHHKAALACTPVVARILAKELGRDEAWIEAQIEAMDRLAAACLPAPYGAQPGTDS